MKVEEEGWDAGKRTCMPACKGIAGLKRASSPHCCRGLVDRAVFGMRPMHEEVELVRCDRCHRAILAARYQAHRSLGASAAQSQSPSLFATAPSPCNLGATVSCTEQLLSPSRGLAGDSGLAAPDLGHPEDLLTEFDFDLGELGSAGSPAKELELLDLSELNLFEDGRLLRFACLLAYLLICLLHCPLACFIAHLPICLLAC